MLTRPTSQGDCGPTGARARSGDEMAARLVAALTNATAGVLGEQTRAGTTIELVATPRAAAPRAALFPHKSLAA
jgi:hypothetical protein